jgi:hypothetical protein
MDKVYRTNDDTEEELKENVRIEILVVSREKLIQVNFNLFKRERVCVCTGTSFPAPLTKTGKFILLLLWSDT